jgi:hypothetical protein
MSKVSEYRQHTRECRNLAKMAKVSQHREMLLDIAAAWDSLANDRIKTTEGLARIAELPPVSWPPWFGLPSALLTSIDRAGQDDTRGPKKRWKPGLSNEAET